MYHRDVDIVFMLESALAEYCCNKYGKRQQGAKPRLPHGLVTTASLGTQRAVTARQFERMPTVILEKPHFQVRP